MDVRRARSFVTIAELGSITKAAARLRIAQPALSRQISDLEHELGLTLFDRLGRRLVLTSNGEQLLGDCRSLVAFATTIDERAHGLRSGDTGVLKVAASPQHIESVLSLFLNRYEERHPAVKVQVIEAPGIETISMLERGEIHLGQNLGHALAPDDRRFQSQLLGYVDLLAVCLANVRVSDTDTIELDNLAEQPLLLMDSQFAVRRAFDAACRLAGFKPIIKMESRTPHTLLALAEAGHGVAIVPSQLQTHRYALNIFGVNYQGKPVREPMIILWDERRPQPPYARAFCEMLAEYVAEVFPISRPAPAKS